MSKSYTNQTGPIAQKAVILARVSTKEQEDGYSIDAQLHRLNDYCERKGLTILKTLSFSESSTLGTRTQFHETLKYIKKQREPVALVTDKVDRLQRSLKDFEVLDGMIQSGNLELHFNTENQIVHQHSTSQDRLMWSIHVVMAQSYVDANRDNVIRSIAQKIRNGEWISTAPIGYLNTKQGKKSWIEIDPLRGSLVKKLFEEYATGAYTLSEITEKAKIWGLRNKVGNRGYLSKSYIHKIFNNPFYFGIMRVKGEHYPHVYEPLIDKTLFDQCQSVMKGWHKKPFQYRSINFLFRGMLNCDVSGRLVTSDRKRRTYKNGNKAEWIYLRCQNPDEPNKQMWVREEKISDQVTWAFKSLHVPKSLRSNIIEYIHAEDQADNDRQQKSLDALVTDQARLTGQLDKLLNLLMDETINRDEYSRKRSDLIMELAAVKDRIKHHAKDAETNDERLSELIELTSDCAEIFKGSTIDTKRRLMKLIFANLTMKGDKLLFSLHEPFNHLRDLGENKKWCAQVDMLRTSNLSRAELDRVLEQLRAIVNARQLE